MEKSPFVFFRKFIEEIYKHLKLQLVSKVTKLETGHSRHIRQPEINLMYKPNFDLKEYSASWYLFNSDVTLQNHILYNSLTYEIWVLTTLISVSNYIILTVELSHLNLLIFCFSSYIYHTFSQYTAMENNTNHSMRL